MPGRRRDRFGLRPVRAGRLRGEVRNVRRDIEMGAFGSEIVFEFDLIAEEGAPAVAVRMSGTDFSGQPHDGQVVEVQDPDPARRPLIAHRLDLPLRRREAVIAYYPGRNDLTPAQQRLRGVLVVLGPLAFAAAAIGLFIVFSR
jgi:hypothetical protein